MSIFDSHPKGKWRRVSSADPCPVCGKPDWCSVSPDGSLVACRRNEAGAWKCKTDRNGTPFFLHRQTGSASPSSSPAAPGEARCFHRADPDTLNAVYSALLANLSLSNSHRGDLQRRGMPDSEIDRRMYRTLPAHGRARIATVLQERFGTSLLRVPGLFLREREGRRYLTIAGSAGLLIPVRDVAGRVVALKVRRDDDGVAKYVWLSSVRHGGPGPGAPVHVPLGTILVSKTLRLTEGPLKADLAAVLSGFPTVGMPGVNWRPAIATFRELEADTCRLSLDNDAADKPAVARALGACASGFIAEKIAIELERWPAQYKGVDDALAGGATIEVLSGDNALRATTEIVAAGTAGETIHQPNLLDRLNDVLVQGSESLYRDKELLRALAELAETEPGEWACIRTKLDSAGIRRRDFDGAITRLRREFRASQPRPEAAGSYRVSAGKIVRVRGDEEETPLCNFSARIAEVIARDDGVEQATTFAIEGNLTDGAPLPRVNVLAKDFPRMDWVTPVWQGEAVVYAGLGTRDHLRCAIELLSPDKVKRVEYVHTGWREIDGCWLYLHGGGAIGPNGPVSDVRALLSGSLAAFVLPVPPESDDLHRAIRASLRVLDVAPDQITLPLLAAVFRAPIGGTDFTVWFAGATGTGKTEITTLAQQHYGASFHSRGLPGSWSSTANALETLAFAVKDGLFVVDDYVPDGKARDVAHLQREANRLMRAQGNSKGRQRLNADSTLRPEKPPRGLLMGSGEDVPSGQSVRARMLIVEMSKNDMHWSHLTACQSDAAAGLYASTMAGFLGWLARRHTEIRQRRKAETAEIRDRARIAGAHTRTPGIVAELVFGFSQFLIFAMEVGAITMAEREALEQRAWRALLSIARAQCEHAASSDAAQFFIRLLAGLLASGRTHVANRDGGEPPAPSAWGWRRAEGGSGSQWSPQGRGIGWLDGSDLYLEPESVFAEAQRLAGDQNEVLPFCARTLWRLLRDGGMLASWDKDRGRNTVRRSMGGVQHRNVLHLRADVMSHPEPDLTEVDVAVDSRNGQSAGNGDRPNVTASTKSSRISAGDSLSGQCGRSYTRTSLPPEVNDEPTIEVFEL